MFQRRFGLGFALLAILTVASTGCVHVQHDHPAKIARAKRHEPPPHAPAHGYRHKHGDGVDLVFDSKLGVYIVVGYEDHYFNGSRYFRWRDGWQVGTKLRGDWSAISARDLPPGLLKKKGRGRAKGHGKPKQVPAKHGY